MSVGCSFFTGLGRSSVFFVEAHRYCDFPRGLHELPAFAIKIGCQNANCPGCLTSMLKSPAVCTKRPSQRYADTKKVYGHNVFKSTCLPSSSAACEDHVPAGSEDFYRCLDVRKSGGQAVASEQQELTRERGKTRYKCASGCAESRAPRAVSRCCSTGLTLRSLALTGSLDSVPSL